MKTLYETDVIDWANKQVGLLRAEKMSEIDIKNITKEKLLMN